MSEVAQHTYAVWQGTANAVLMANLSTYGMPGRFEQMWAKRVSEGEFVICCIPFFTYGICLGDRVEAKDFEIRKVTEKGGHKTIRVGLRQTPVDAGLHILLHDWIERQGLSYEWHGDGYVAIDVPPGADTRAMLASLEATLPSGAVAVEIDE